MIKCDVVNKDLTVTFVEGDTLYSKIGNGEKETIRIVSKNVNVSQRTFKLKD